MLLNAALKSYVTVTKVGDKMFRLMCLSLKDENSKEFVPTTYLFKLKSIDDADTTFNIIKTAVDSCINVSNKSTRSS